MDAPVKKLAKASTANEMFQVLSQLFMRLEIKGTNDEKDTEVLKKLAA